MAAGSVGRVREERAEGPLGHDGALARVVPLHFAEDHAARREARGGVGGIDRFEVVPFLGEGLGAEEREEDRVAVDPHDVEVVRPVDACRRVDGLVRKRPGVQVGMHAPLEQNDEGILQGEAFRAAEHRVLEDVRHAVGGGGRGAEGEREGVLIVVVRDVEEPEPGFIVDQAYAHGIELPQRNRLFHRKSMQRSSRLKRLFFHAPASVLRAGYYVMHFICIGNCFNKRLN